MFSTIGTIFQKGVQVFHAGVQGIQAGVSALVQGGVSAIKSNAEFILSQIGEKPTEEEIVEMVNE